MIMEIRLQSGEQPNLILMHSWQFTKLLNLLEDQKRFEIPAKDSKFKISYSALSFEGPEGEIPIMTSRFIDSDKVFILNTDKIKLHLRPGGFGWFDQDGTVFLRNATADQLDARYMGYGQLFVNPHFHGYLYGLTV